MLSFSFFFFFLFGGESGVRGFVIFLCAQTGSDIFPTQFSAAGGGGEPVLLMSLKPSPQCTISHMLTQSLPPILEPSRGWRATEPGLHSSRGREGRGGEVGGEFSVAMFCGSLLSGGSMGPADFEG